MEARFYQSKNPEFEIPPDRTEGFDVGQLFNFRLQDCLNLSCKVPGFLEVKITRILLPHFTNLHDPHSNVPGGIVNTTEGNPCFNQYHTTVCFVQL